MKKIAVYCGASTGEDPHFKKAAFELGKWIVSNNYELIYGGGKYGLMGILANSVLENGGRVTGILPQNLFDRNVALSGITKLEVVADMALRKKRMIELADVCIALPGGVGTLEEIVEAYSWTRIGDNSSPCILLNINHYYDLLEQFFNQMVTTNFLSTAHLNKLCFAKTLSEVTEFIDTYSPPKLRSYQ
ncbi:MAG: TIGR00730 family Rossman fold protein [Liquorilactobacillus hordei]|uniref:Cytokinin riboside 5'-monophosphate phosphoribohydrolase n=1 Tax=Liquorilactobacillus hordei TaxID=468911 RepID=A0A3S6QTB9_9LACO|nr:TIGR00730 family Rossman fold protein [Liquorilactobacillus hordei]AUJ29525.1 Rossman fold protein, TIGR00730 family [Liquorilactobacillus hordei]MBZ2405224.1 TIGR00730 family Rossman fold protein [Liquorilactobacillus hordei]